MKNDQEGSLVQAVKLTVQDMSDTAQWGDRFV
jgi:hypothetical protein